MKKTLLMLACALFAIQVEAAPANTTIPAITNATNIAVVNVQQLFQQSPKIADLNKKLQDQFKPTQDKISTEQKTVQELAEKVQHAAPAGKDKDSLQKELVDAQTKLARDAATFQQDLTKEQNKIMRSVLTELTDVIASIAKKNNYIIVLDSQAIIYSAENTDITKEVSKEFDKK